MPNKSKKVDLSFESITDRFENEPPVYLDDELAVGFVLAVLTVEDSYGT